MNHNQQREKNLCESKNQFSIVSMPAGFLGDPDEEEDETTDSGGGAVG